MHIKTSISANILLTIKKAMEAKLGFCLMLIILGTLTVQGGIPRNEKKNPLQDFLSARGCVLSDGYCTAELPCEQGFYHCSGYVCGDTDAPSCCCPCPGQAVNIHIRSEGCNDPDKTPDTCGIAYIYVNGVDKSPHSRGHNVVVLDGATGAFLDAKAFDTYGDSNAGVELRDYLNSITGDKIVLVAIQNEGSRYVAAAIDALKRVGATEPILTDFRGSFALVGYAGDTTPAWITQEQRNSAQGPSEVTVQIPLSPRCWK